VACLWRHAQGMARLPRPPYVPCRRGMVWVRWMPPWRSRACVLGAEVGRLHLGFRPVPEVMSANTQEEGTCNNKGSHMSHGVCKKGVCVRYR